MIKRRYPYMPHRRRFLAISPPSDASPFRRQFERMCRENAAHREMYADIRAIVDDVDLIQATTSAHFMDILAIKRILKGAQP